MCMWALPGPFLASSSRSSLVLAASVVSSFADGLLVATAAIYDFGSIVWLLARCRRPPFVVRLGLFFVGLPWWCQLRCVGEALCFQEATPTEMVCKGLASFVVITFSFAPRN